MRRLMRLTRRPVRRAGNTFELTLLERCRVAFRTLLSRVTRVLVGRILSQGWYLHVVLHLVDVRPREGFRLWCKFNDGMQGAAMGSGL